MDKFQILKDCMATNRSYRRFDNSRRVDAATLKEVVALTRYCAGAMNKQPLRYRIVSDVEECAKLYPLLKWAGYLKDWDGPVESERPVAYIVQCLDTSCIPSFPYCDEGLHLETITLGLNTLNMGGCIIKAFDGKQVAEVLSLPAEMQPCHVLAVGYPVEKVVLEDMKDDDCKYWREADGTHHVPKRPLDEVII